MDRILDGMSLMSDSCSETSAEHFKSSAPEDESPERNSIKRKLKLYGLSSDSDDQITDSDDEKHRVKTRNGKIQLLQ